MSPWLILEQHTRSAETRRNSLGDDRYQIDYAAVPEHMDAIAEMLAAHGIDAGTCVALECPNTLAGALAVLALMRGGITFVLAPPVMNPSDLKPVPRFCRVRMTLDGGHAKAGFHPEAECRIEGNAGYEANTAPGGKLLLRTSGSMGASKIVVHDQKLLWGNARNVMRKYGFTAESRATIPVPVAHMYGLGAEFLPAILAGASVDLQDKTNLLKFLDHERRFRPDIAFVTPAICEMLTKGYKTPRTCYRVVVTSGQRIGEPLFRAFDALVGGRLINQYGSSELGAIAACDTADSQDARATTIGAPFDGAELRVREGVLECRHPCAYEGYLNESGEWLHRHSVDEWYATGDVAAESPEGRITVLGRADASVNRSGYLVLLSDIERIMERLDAAREVAVVAARDETVRGPRLVAFCVAWEGAVAADLRNRCFEVLPHYAIPDEVRFIDTMPLLASGKIDRQALTRLAE